ncbi:hypothetical protein NA8A_04853 [Nitratireductor indicus C115]|uniref:Large polyvalent protein associated domain-containing protein n=1 Tax=Nitratireductor indicus C115 TaxID=1231190 RepID=K2PQK0_9HYPH|nr:hypothetical protein [Nitratireductor indicus]EKF43332.1 hypothetical protein NA8A_04853 [Nitratireductor indicus C115]SFQ09836.1 hypothetical protein SAMN05216176_101334 [Nitratireductor indicus]
MSFVYETPQANPTATFARRGGSTLFEIGEAAWRSALYVDNFNAAQTSLDRAYEDRIARVKAETGIVLENPLRTAESRFTRQKDMNEVSPIRKSKLFGGPGEQGRDPYQILLDQEQKRFSDRLAEIAAQHPDKAALIGSEISVEDDAKRLAQKAEGDLLSAITARDGIGKWGALLAGGMAGAMRDPLQVMTLFAGAGPGTGRSIAARILSIASKEALVNGATEALFQPTVQAWREEAGLPHGLNEAMSNVAFATALGGAFGLAGGAIAEGARAFRGVELDAAAELAAARNDVSPDARAALSGDVDAARRILPEIREALPAEVRGALDQADQLDHLDATRPASVSRTAHDQNAARATRLAEDGDFPGFIPDAEQTARIADQLIAIDDATAIRQLKEAAGEQGRSLVSYLIDAGGLKPDIAELEQIGATRVSRSFEGRLVRPGGKSLDYAREAVAEAGYFDHLYGTPEEAVARSTPADLLNLIEDELGGKPAFPPGIVSDAARQAAETVAANRRAVEARVAEMQAMAGPGVDDKIITRAVEIAERDGGDPADAFERAVMEQPEPKAAPSEIDVEEMARRLGNFVIEERLAPVPAVTDKPRVQRAVASYLSENAEKIDPRDVILQDKPQWAYVLDREGKTWKLKRPFHEDFFNAIRANENQHDEALGNAAEFAIFRVSHIAESFTGGVDFFGFPTNRQIKAFRKLKHAMGGREDTFSVSLWRAPGPNAGVRSGEVLPGWSDDELKAASEYRPATLEANGLDDPMPSRLPEDPQEAAFRAEYGDTEVMNDAGEMVPLSAYMDELDRQAEIAELVELCKVTP